MYFNLNGTAFVAARFSATQDWMLFGQGLSIGCTALNMVFAIRMLNAQRRAVQSGSQFWGGLNLWILACWVATFTNLSFDVYLEGPQGGIWFWSIIGLGIAALRIQAHETRQSLLWSQSKGAEALKIGYASA